MVETSRSNWRRTINRYVFLVTAVVGLIIVASSFFFVADVTKWYATVLVGLVFVLGGAWYGTHPFMTSERRYLLLRAELDRFVKLVRELNRAALDPEAEAEFQRVKSAMLESIERMAESAGKEG